MPMTQIAINAFLTVTGVATALHIPDLVARFAKEDRGGAWQLPQRPVVSSGGDNSPPAPGLRRADA